MTDHDILNLLRENAVLKARLIKWHVLLAGLADELNHELERHSLPIWPLPDGKPGQVIDRLGECDQ